MKVSELIFALLQMPDEAEVSAVDQWGVTQSPLTGVRRSGVEVLLDVDVPTDEDEAV